MRGWEGVTESDLRQLGAAGAAPKPKSSKYRAVPTEVEGIRFASKREADRFLVLREEQRRGMISDLMLQEQFALHVLTPDNVKVQVGTCRMDFTYTKDGRRIREDCKGIRTNEAYRQRKRHVEAEYAIQVLET